MSLFGDLTNILGAGADWLFGSDPPPPPEKIPAPPPPPDLTDVAVRQARLGARRRALSGAGLSSTFLSGPLGDLSAPFTAGSSLGGY
jgi:hypothetical protein